MSADLRVTEGRTYPRYWTENILNGVYVVSTTTPITNSPKCIGNYQDVRSERAGSFKPGNFRLNPATLRKSSCHSTAGSIRTPMGKVYGSYTYISIHGELVYISPIFGVTYPKRGAECLCRAIAKSKDVSANLGVMGAELGETLQLLLHPTRKLIQLFAKLRNRISSRMTSYGVPKRGSHKSDAKFVYRRVKTTLDSVTGAWMAYRYGIMPFIYDICDIIDAFERGLSRNMAMVSTRAQSVEDVTESQAVTSYTQGLFSWKRLLTHRRVSKVVSIAYYQYLEERAMRLRLLLLGLDPSQIASLVWELVPYSFVVDWFVDFGQWIQATVPNPAIKYLGYCVSHKEDIYSQADLFAPTCYYSAANKDLIVTPARCSAVSSTLIREVSTSADTYMSANLDPLNLKRTLDSLSMLWQKGRKLLPRI